MSPFCHLLPIRIFPLNKRTHKNRGPIFQGTSLEMLNILKSHWSHLSVACKITYARNTCTHDEPSVHVVTLFLLFSFASLSHSLLFVFYLYLVLNCIVNFLSQKQYFPEYLYSAYQCNGTPVLIGAFGHNHNINDNIFMNIYKLG